MSAQVNGQTEIVPGTYGYSKIVQLGGAAIPSFNVGVIIGKQAKGTPYTAGIGSPPSLTADKFILPYSEESAFQAAAGAEGDNESLVFFRHAKKQGAGQLYFIGVNPLTKCVGGVVQNAVAGAVLSVAIHGGNAGTLYRHGDLLTVAGGNGDLVLSVATVDADGVVLTVTIVSPGTGYTVQSTGAVTTSSPAGGSGCKIDISTVATGQNALTFSSKGYGAPVNDTSLSIAGSVHTVIPPKNSQLLQQNSGTGETIYVGLVDPSIVRVGDTWLLVDNAYAAPVSMIVESIDTVANTITFTTAIAASALTSNYARIFQEDTDNQEVSSASTTPAQVQAFYNASKILNVVIGGAVTVMPTTLAKTYISALTSATPATSPAASPGDWQAVADNFARWNEEFALFYGYRMRIIGLVTPDAGNHAAFRDMAIESATNGRTLGIVTGCALGDYVLSNSNYPPTRLALLNRDNIQVAGFGIDGYDAYLSYAGQIFGVRVSKEVDWNQTGNPLVVDSSVEQAYSPIDPAIAPFVLNGVMTIGVTKSGYQIIQGVTAYQDHVSTFNSSTEQTYLVRNRDLADYTLFNGINVIAALGNNGVTPQMIQSVLGQNGQDMVDSGKITGYKVVSITKNGNAWKAVRQCSIESSPDFFVYENQILVDAGGNV